MGTSGLVAGAMFGLLVGLGATAVVEPPVAALVAFVAACGLGAAGYAAGS